MCGRTSHGMLVVRRLGDVQREKVLPAPGLCPEEVTFAQGLGERRWPTWVGGRLALREALALAGLDAAAPILSTPRGAPALPVEIGASIAHKDDIAVALAAPMTELAGRLNAQEAAVGVDVEWRRPPRGPIERWVMTPYEQSVLAGLEPAQRWQWVVRLFCLKEALYKALDPFVGRHVGFKEVEIDVVGDDAAIRSWFLRDGEGPFVAELACHPLVAPFEEEIWICSAIVAPG